MAEGLLIAISPKPSAIRRDSKGAGLSEAAPFSHGMRETGMRERRIVSWAGLAASFAAGATLVNAGQQSGVGQTPGGVPLAQSVRERGSSLTGAYEGLYYGKDGATYALVGYFNRNTKQEFDIPVGPNNRVE